MTFSENTCHAMLFLGVRAYGLFQVRCRSGTDWECARLVVPHQPSKEIAHRSEPTNQCTKCRTLLISVLTKEMQALKLIVDVE